MIPHPPWSQQTDVRQDGGTGRHFGSQLVPIPPPTDVYTECQGQGGSCPGSHTEGQVELAAEWSCPNASPALCSGVPLLLGLGKVSGSN